MLINVDYIFYLHKKKQNGYSIIVLCIISLNLLTFGTCHVLNILHISNFILKLYVFIIFLYSYFPSMAKIVSVLARATERTKNLSIIFIYFVDI